MTKKKPLTIAMVVASPFPANHGTPGSIGETAEAVAQKGHHVHVVAYHFGDGSVREKIRLHRIPDFGFKRDIVVGPTKEKPLLDLLMIFTLCRVITREKVDVIHAHNYEGAMIGYAAKILTGRPLIYNAVNTMISELPTYDFFKPKSLAVCIAKVLDCVVPRMADRIIAISRELERFLVSGGIRSTDIRRIPLGVDLTKFRAGMTGSGGEPSPNRPVIYTGILDPLQRVDYLLKAMRVVADRMACARLLMVVNLAKAADWERTESMIAELGLGDHVRMATNNSFSEIPDYLCQGDVAVVCRPYCPGFPVKLLNYMAAGKAIVTFEGSAKGLKHMETAILVKNHDWEAFGQAILKLLQDPALTKRLGQNAHAWVRAHYGWDTIVKQLEETYYECANKRRQT